MYRKNDVDLTSLSTFGLKAKTQQLVVLEHEADLDQLDIDQPMIVLGEGSNTVFLESFQGTIVQPKFKGIDVKESSEDYRIEVAAGENWHTLVSTNLKKGYYGLENLALIPGSVGAAPVQNIGAYGVELSDFCAYVRWFDFKQKQIQKIPHENCGFGYRDSVFKQQLAGQGIIVAVGLQLPKVHTPCINYAGLDALGATATPQQVFDRVVEIRQNKIPNPHSIPNVGSFFKNPIVSKATWQRIKSKHTHMPFYQLPQQRYKIPAAWLLDHLGFKGLAVGGVGVHTNQPLVLTNLGNATGRDVMKMVAKIRQAVVESFAIDLEPEVRLIGQCGLINE